jgi:arylsulfatase A-like enzyme
VNPVDVPGVLFCNEKIERDNPHIMDIGPTVLDLFGVEVPAYCDGKPLMPEEEEEE